MTALQIQQTAEGNRADDHFGLCPACHQTDGYLDIGPDHWFFCKTHKVKWCPASNVFSSWQDETPEEQQAVCERLGFDEFETVEPFRWPSRTPDAI